jgi:lipopolysaccharide export system protein LptA
MQTTNDVLREVFGGRLNVSIEGLGEFGITSGSGDTLSLSVATVECVLTGRAVIQSDPNNDDRYEVISFDREKGKIVVRRK